MNDSDIQGKRFGNLVAQRKAPVAPGGARWHCVCDCGHSRVAKASRLRSGQTRHCNDDCHGGKGSTDHPLYVTWRGMLKRCYDPGHNRYHRYGGRGIQVCDEWQLDFWAFVSDVGEKPSLDHQLDRIDNDGNYEPGNVRWATRQEQANNRPAITRRDTHCSNGHEMTPENSYHRPDGSQIDCKTCKRIDSRRRKRETRNAQGR